jgi:hypothetical protein
VKPREDRGDDCGALYLELEPIQGGRENGAGNETKPQVSMLQKVRENRMILQNRKDSKIKNLFTFFFS